MIQVKVCQMEDMHQSHSCHDEDVTMKKYVTAVDGLTIEKVDLYVDLYVMVRLHNHL